MSTIIVSLIIVGLIVLLTVIFNPLQKRNKAIREKQMIVLFNQTGEKNGLSFSSQEVLKNKVIGLDGIHRKFVILNDPEKSRIIDLDEVKRCKTQKGLETYSRAGERASGYEMFTKSISLVFEFHKRREPETVVFWDYLTDSAGKEKLLEAKAKDWEMILNKMIISCDSVTA